MSQRKGAIPMTEVEAWTRRQMMRRLGATGAVLALPNLLAACGGGDEKAASGGATATPAAGGRPEIKSKTVIFADYGGAESEQHKKVFFDPFLKETGIRVTTVTDDPAKFAIMSQRKRPIWDIAELDGFQVIQLFNKGLLVESPEWVAKCDLVPEKYRSHAPGLYAYSLQIGYRNETFSGGGPESWADFFDLKKFPGKRAIPNFYYGVAEAALLADGVSKDALYPLDFDRAFAKLDELKGHVLYTESYGEGAQFVQSGSVAMAMLPNGRLGDLINKGEKVTQVWNEAILFPWGACGIPQGAPHLDAAFALADWMAKPEPQAEYARRLGYGPSVSKAFEFLTDDELKMVPNSPDNQKIAAVADNEALAIVNDEYAKRYEEYLTKRS
jgi:putative spermidine/putrescine transport system substrate-binding protein